MVRLLIQDIRGKHIFGGGKEIGRFEITQLDSGGYNWTYLEPNKSPVIGHLPLHSTDVIEVLRRCLAVIGGRARANGVPHERVTSTGVTLRSVK